jgi:hypothetical protein
LSQQKITGVKNSAASAAQSLVDELGGLMAEKDVTPADSVNAASACVPIYRHATNWQNYSPQTDRTQKHKRH